MCACICVKNIIANKIYKMRGKVIGYLQNNIYNHMFNVNREYISKKRVIYNLYRRERANKMVEVKELFKNTEEYINKEVTVGGWVRSIRDSKLLAL